MLTGMTPVATLPLMLTSVLVFLRGVTGSGVPKSTPQDSAFLFRSRIRTWSPKFVKNRTRTRSHFSISAVAGVCVVISLSKSMDKLRLD